MQCPVRRFSAVIIALAFAAPLCAAQAAEPEKSFQDTVKTDVEHHQVTVTEAARDRIAGDSLTTILNQSASAPVFDQDGELRGYRLFDIDRGSIYDLVGLKNGDVVTHIDDTLLTSAELAVNLLRYVKNQPEFSYTVQRLAGTAPIRYHVRIE